MFDRKEIRDYRQVQALVLDESSSNNMVKAEGNSPKSSLQRATQASPQECGFVIKN